MKKEFIPLTFGLIIYICSIDSAPLDYAFITQRINIGVGMVILLVETITSWGTTPVLKKELDCKTLLTYLTVVSALALTLGYLSSNVHAKTKSR